MADDSYLEDDAPKSPDLNSSILSIDQEEFARMQSQLLQLREENYGFREDVSKKQAELHRFEAVYRELEKCRKIISKSKKAKEAQMLVEEAESMQRKLETQEGEFRLQNKTVMDELSLVLTEKDELEKKVSQLESSDSSPGASQDRGSDQVLKLKAEVAALRTSLESTGVSTEEGSNVEDVLRLNTALEENKLLYGQLQTLRDEHQKESTKLRAANTELADKLKRKQESILQLQQEKEDLFAQKQAAASEAMKVYEVQNKLLTRQLGELQDTLAVAEQDKTPGDNSEGIVTLRTELEKQSSENADLRQQIESHLQKPEHFEDQLKQLQKEAASLQAKATEAEELADKRRCTINELSERGHAVDQDHRAKVAEIKDQWKVETNGLKRELEAALEQGYELTAENGRLLEEMEVTNELKDKNSSLAQQLEDKESEWASEKDQILQSEEALRQEHKEEAEKLQEQLDEENQSYVQLAKQCEEYKQTLQDKDGEVAIAERKFVHQLKDLKRQLQQAHKKEEKLQHQLVESRTRASHDNLLTVPVTDTRRQHSRESSQSSVKGILPETPESSLHGVPSSELGSLDSDTQDLLGRITQLQTEKWSLETRVSHLEQNNAAFAEDLLQKTAVIQNYFVANKADHSEPLRDPSSSPDLSRNAMVSPMKLMQRLAGGRNSEVEHLKEVIGKLQRSMEEALMKNIHLQQSMDIVLKDVESQKDQEKLSSPAQLECASDP